MTVQHVQLIPNIAGPRRLCLGRIYLQHECDGRTHWRGAKLSISVIFEPRDAWVGLFWDRNGADLLSYVCLIPFLPIRFHWKVSYGGYFG